MGVAVMYGRALLALLLCTGAVSPQKKFIEKVFPKKIPATERPKTGEFIFG